MSHVDVLKERKKDLVVHRIRGRLSQFDQLLVGSLEATLDVLLDVREDVVNVSCQQLFVSFRFVLFVRIDQSITINQHPPRSAKRERITNSVALETEETGTGLATKRTVVGVGAKELLFKLQVRADRFVEVDVLLASVDDANVSVFEGNCLSLEHGQCRRSSVHNVELGEHSDRSVSFWIKAARNIEGIRGADVLICGRHGQDDGVLLFAISIAQTEGDQRRDREKREQQMVDDQDSFLSFLLVGREGGRRTEGLM